MSLENKEPNPLGSSTTIPLPVMTSTESLRASGMERNKGIWYLLKHNWRQLTSLAPGELESHKVSRCVSYAPIFFIFYHMKYKHKYMHVSVPSYLLKYFTIDGI